MTHPGDKKCCPWLEEWHTLHSIQQSILSGYNWRELLILQLRPPEALLIHDVAHCGRLETGPTDNTRDWMIARAEYLLYQLDQMKSPVDIDRTYARMNEAQAHPQV